MDEVFLKTRHRPINSKKITELTELLSAHLRLEFRLAFPRKYERANYRLVEARFVLSNPLRAIYDYANAAWLIREQRFAPGSFEQFTSYGILLRSVERKNYELPSSRN